MKKTAILCLATLAFVAVATAQNHSHAQQPVYRARVILHTDTIRGPENRDNHVNRTFQLLQVIRKFNETHDLMVCFGLNGPNGMFGLRGWKLIPNTTTQLAHFPPNGHFVEISELVGPWHIRALHNPVGRSGQKFT